jgi:hypothetical protein
LSPSQQTNPGGSSEIEQQERVALGQGDQLLSLYGIAVQKRINLDNLMWQVPVLSITAQAFLLTIALGPTTRWAGRFAAACLGCVVAIATVQLLLKQRLHEEGHSRWLQEVEELAGLPAQHPPRRMNRLLAGTDSFPEARLSPLTKLRSYQVWVVVLSLFGVVDALVILLGVLHGVTGLHVWDLLDTPAPPS